jgi:RNA polymerase sigma-70 factor (ECF subfamily)
VTSEPGVKEAPVAPEQFLELVHQYDRRLRALAFRLLGDSDRMDDALQDAYLKAFRAFPGFRSEASVGTWLYRIVYNTCIDEMRRSARANLVPIPDIPDPVPGSDPAEVVLRAEDLSTALRELGDQDRALVLLVDADGLSYREAAEVLDLPLGTVASRLHRTRAALRHSLDDQRGVR